MAREVTSTTFRKWVQLLSHLREGTKKGSIPWKATADNEVFLVSLKGAVILFGSRLDVLDNLDYFVELKNESGDTIEEFTDVDLDRGADAREFLKFMKDMHIEIQRKLSGADEILDSAIQQISSLNDDIPF